MDLELPCGRIAVVDDGDHDLVVQHRWSFNGQAYVRANTPSGSTLYLHRYLLGVTDPRVTVDHRDRDPLNNRRSNLRIASFSQNLANSGARTGTYKGVSLNSRPGRRKRWVAQIAVGGQYRHLGYFTTPEEAAHAYDAAALEAWGEFTYLNFPKGAL